jgi:hypothetical protein
MLKPRLLFARLVVGAKACLRSEAMMVGVLRVRDGWAVVNDLQVLVVGLRAKNPRGERLALTMLRLMR